MEDKINLVMECLFKKWETLWNHYRFQNDTFDRRIAFLWIIQGAMFIGLYNCIGKFNWISFLIPFIGLFVSLGWILISKRHIESMFLTEIELRDVEEQWNAVCIKYNIPVKLDKFILDKKCIWDGDEIVFENSLEKFNEDVLRKLWTIDNWPINKIDNYLNKFIEKFPKMRSISLSLGSVLPKGFLIIWGILLIITIITILCGTHSTLINSIQKN